MLPALISRRRLPELCPSGLRSGHQPAHGGHAHLLRARHRCAWDDANFIMAAGTKAGSDTQDTHGIVDGHACACA